MPTKQNTCETEQKQCLTDIPVTFGFHTNSQIREEKREITLKIELLIFNNLLAFEGDHVCNIFVI